MKRLIALLFIAAVLASAQTTTAPAPATGFLLGLGAGYNTAGYSGMTTQRTGALLTLGILPAGSSFMNLTTLILQPGNPSGINTIRTGVGYRLTSGTSCFLVATGDAGATSTSTAVLGNVGAGLLALCDPGTVIKPLANAGIHIGAGIRLAAISGNSVQPEYSIMVSKKF